MNKYQNINQQSGFVVLGSTFVFMLLSILLCYSILQPLLTVRQDMQGAKSSKLAISIAQSAVDEVLYKLGKSLDLDAAEQLQLGTAEADIVVADTSGGKTVTVTASHGEVERTVQMTISETVGVNFNYGLQAGRGGFIMSGGAYIDGNVYSNGDIVGSGGPYVTGDATVANGADPDEDVSHIVSLPASYDINFGGNATPQDAAQSFVAGTTVPITSAQLMIKKSTTGWMNNITLRLTTDNGGKPSKTTLASATISASQVTTSYNVLTTPFSSTVSLIEGETYWIVLDSPVTWGANYSLAANMSTFTDGVAMVGEWRNNNGGTWSNTTPSGLDTHLIIYAGGDTGLIDGVDVGTSGIGDAWAHEVADATVSGTIYCQASTNTNKACDTSRADPTPQPFPLSDGNILDWKAEAEAGGTTVGNQSYGSSDIVTIGPGKIEGDLSVGAGATVYIDGTVWVTGDISVSGGASIELSLAYGNSSGVIVSDGNITAGGSGTFAGNGLSDSYILVISTSECYDSLCGGDPSISVSGGTSAVVFNAQNGAIEFSGGAMAKQATAHQIRMSGGTSVRYESGLADMNFNGGPAGSWTVESWEEI